MGSTYKSFCPTDKSDSTQNPRLAVLENFKEISRIMTQNFITHKKLEKRYEKSSIPKMEMSRKRIEEEAANRMTNILKMMHSPNNFSQPLSLLPFQKIHPLDGKDRKSLMASSEISKARSVGGSILKAKEESHFTPYGELPSLMQSYNTKQPHVKIDG